MLKCDPQKVRGRLAYKNPNIWDLLINPAFYQPNGSSCQNNRWCNFWNLMGARNHTNVGGMACAVCGQRIAHQPKRKHQVCQRCLPRYLRDVAAGRRVAALMVRRYAA